MRRLRLCVKAAGLLCALIGSAGVVAASSVGSSAGAVAVDPVNAVIAAAVAMGLGIFVYGIRARRFS